MYGNWDFAADVVPIITGFINSDIVHAGVALLIGLSLAVFASRAIVSVFFKRE